MEQKNMQYTPIAGIRATVAKRERRQAPSSNPANRYRCRIIANTIQVKMQAANRSFENEYVRESAGVETKASRLAPSAAGNVACNRAIRKQPSPIKKDITTFARRQPLIPHRL
jgi:hypothetical protein